MALVESMWMHFHGQMSTQPSHRMHSAWSMCRNCLGFTAWVSHLGSTSCRTYEVENSGIGGFASLRAMSTRSLSSSEDDASAADVRLLASSLRSPRRVTRGPRSSRLGRGHWAAVCGGALGAT